MMWKLSVLFLLPLAGMAQHTRWPSYMVVGVCGGTTALANTSGRWEVEYTDESGSAQYVYAERVLKGFGQTFSLGLTLEGGRERALHWEGSFHLGTAAPTYLRLGGGLGYNFTTWDLYIRPKLQVFWGMVSAGLGEINNVGSGLVVNGGQFVEDRIDLRLTTNFLGAGAGLDLLYPLSNTLGVQGSVAYLFPVTTISERLVFSENAGEESFVRREKITEPNVYVYRNNDRVEALDFRTQGVAATIGLVIRIDPS